MRKKLSAKKILVACVGVGAVSYVIACEDSTTATSGNLLAPTDAGSDVATSGNLLAPIDSGADVSTSGNLLAPIDSGTDAKSDAGDGGDGG